MIHTDEHGTPTFAATMIHRVKSTKDSSYVPLPKQEVEVGEDLLLGDGQHSVKELMELASKNNTTDGSN